MTHRNPQRAAWWKKKAVCELCGAKLRTGSALLVEEVYEDGGETKMIRDVCEPCRRRHLRPVDQFPDARELLGKNDAARRAAAEAMELKRQRRQEEDNALIAELQSEHLSWREEEVGDFPLPSDAERILDKLGERGKSALMVRALCETMLSTNLKPSVRVHAARYLCGVAYRIGRGDWHPLTRSPAGQELTDADRKLIDQSLQTALCDENADIWRLAENALGYLPKQEG